MAAYFPIREISSYIKDGEDCRYCLPLRNFYDYFYLVSGSEEKKTSG